MRSLIASVAMMVASKGIVTGLLLLPLQYLPYRANALVPYRLPYHSPRGYPRQYLAVPHEGEDSSSSSEKSLEGRIEALESAVRDLVSEVTTMRGAIEGELETLREELRQARTGTTSDDLALPYITSASSSVVLGTTPPDGGKDAVIASAEEAASIVVRLYCKFSTEDTSWNLYKYSQNHLNDPPEYGLTEEQARRNMIVCQDEAEEKTRALRKQLASAKERMEELYRVVCTKMEAGGGSQDPIPVFREVCTLLDGAVENDERSMMDPAATKLMANEKDRVSFCDSLRWAEHLFNKLVREMAG